MGERARRWWCAALGAAMALSGAALLVVLGSEIHWSWRRLLEGEGKLFSAAIPLPFWHIAALLAGWTLVGAWLVARGFRRR